ncbi:TetR/AcrR family transcriptional regulator [Nonomuraea aurantiaca]|uniref:TetR/AcrR family transcriptional regulator n=1 Tax=Nonomuraea aurantiaca TaxID=2878562 RepID=UPI001CDA0336|nr:TetR/AcrR family transcriptional regulator [Nonomuraea aurantiaca]MCA2220373.1 TetR/AcrR family transcriptional regulator [Nonomuraea aurantiaca]
MARGGAGDPDEGVELLWREGDVEPRPGLSLSRIVRTAIELADAEGLEGLSMRKVADRLGFTTMSLYRHVPGRDHLLDLMRDAVMGSPGTVLSEEGGEQGGGWRARLEACAREGWRLRERHPWLAEVRGSRRVPGPNAVAHYEYMLSAVSGTGLTPAEMIAVVGLVARFVDSEALRLAEVARTERLSGVSEEEWWGSRDSLYARFERYPTLTRLWEQGGYDEPEDPFEFGLRRVLDGIEMLVQERDETRDETCQMCGVPVERAASGRPRAYCSRACQQRAYRRRRSG